MNPVGSPAAQHVLQLHDRNDREADLLSADLVKGELAVPLAAPSGGRPGCSLAALSPPGDLLKPADRADRLPRRPRPRLLVVESAKLRRAVHHLVTADAAAAYAISRDGWRWRRARLRRRGGRIDTHERHRHDREHGCESAAHA